MTIRFEMSPDEGRKLGRAVTWRAHRLYGPNWLNKLYWYLALPLTIVIVGILFNDITAAAVSAIVSVALGRGASDLYQHIYRKNERMEPAASPSAEWTVQLQENGVVLKSKLVEHKYAWGYFRFVDVSGDYLHLCASQTKRVAIPKRAFATKADLTSFVTDVDHRIQQAQHPSPPIETH